MPNDLAPLDSARLRHDLRRLWWLVALFAALFAILGLTRVSFSSSAQLRVAQDDDLRLTGLLGGTELELPERDAKLTAAMVDGGAWRSEVERRFPGGSVRVRGISETSLVVFGSGLSRRDAELIVEETIKLIRNTRGAHRSKLAAAAVKLNNDLKKSLETRIASIGTDLKSEADRSAVRDALVTERLAVSEKITRIDQIDRVLIAVAGKDDGGITTVSLKPAQGGRNVPLAVLFSFGGAALAALFVLVRSAWSRAIWTRSEIDRFAGPGATLGVIRSDDAAMTALQLIANGQPTSLVVVLGNDEGLRGRLQELLPGRQIAAYRPDSLVAASQGSPVVVVAVHGRTHRDDLRSALAAIVGVGGQVSGIVLVGVPGRLERHANS